MRISYFNYIIKIAELGSVNLAAQELNISQPALSSIIKNIEQEYKIKIFNRSSTGVTLTANGEEFIKEIRYITDSANILYDISSGTLSGNLKVASIPGVNFALMPEVITRFSQKYPLVSIDLNERISKGVIKEVSSNTASIGICTARYLSDSDYQKFDVIPLFHCPIVACVNKDHPLSKAEQISFKELSSYPIVVFNQMSLEHTYHISQIESPRILLNTTNSQLAKHVVMQQPDSVGIFYSSLLANDRFVESGDLLVKQFIEKNEGSDFCIIYHKFESLSLAEQAFVKLVKECSKRFIEKHPFIFKPGTNDF